MTRPNDPQFPLYVPSKGRSDIRLTSDCLFRIGVHHRVVIEEQEYKAYAKHVPKENLLVLDKSYQDNYDTCDDLGTTKSKGPGPARNFIWDHSISEGYDWHWVMDDNISHFFRYNRNELRRVETGVVFRVMEDFVLRYKNVGMAGPNYDKFVTRKRKHPPFVANTRIYSCNLIRNDLKFRWRGRYNEDTILSLDMLKAGWCTIQFNAFLQNKMTTQVVKGGNTEEFYAKEGTMPKSKMQQLVHPDVSSVVWRFNRWHHHVDYSGFKKLRLIRKDEVETPADPEYGMKLVDSTTKS